MSAEVAVISTGGTIASTRDETAATPQKSGKELIAAVPELSEYATLSVRDIAQVPSFDMDLDTIADVGDAVADVIAADADGVVVTHGTDTMEESAYVLDITRDFDVPVVFTGAQRRPDEHSPDGPANMLAAVRAATHDRLRAAGGVYIAFDMELHSPRDVTKSHTSALGTFDSPDKGPVGSFTRESIRFHRQPGSYSGTFVPTRSSADVRMIKSAVGIGSQQLDTAVEQGVDGVVIEGTGLGNTTSALGNAVGEAVEQGIPVVVTSRCHAGSTGPVYGTDGGGQTLVDNGAVHAGDLPAHKARLKLAFALEAVDEPLTATEYF
ncbi:MAG: asparaginase [Halobacteriota archaeon]|uniref:asparaginase n=1 Tax=Natronomonas sp. TaxID=2184060 RepID=UPI003975FC85